MHGHTSRQRQRHPLRNMCTGAVRLANDQEVVLAEPRTTEDLDLKPCARVVGVVNTDKLHELFVGTMSLLRWDRAAPRSRRAARTPGEQAPGSAPSAHRRRGSSRIAPAS